MRRTDELRPLSHDHHQALVVAQTLSRACDPVPAKKALRWWKGQGQQHFWIEEEIVLTAWWRGCPDADFRLAARMLADHALIRAALHDLQTSGLSIAHLCELGDLIRRHVRFEERELFPLIEDSLDEQALAELGEQIQAAEASICG